MENEENMESIDIFDKIVDSLDIETFIICQSEKEGRRIGLAIMEKLGLHNAVSGWDQKTGFLYTKSKKEL